MKTFVSRTLLAALLPISGQAASIVQFTAGSFLGGEASEDGHLTLTCTPPPTSRVTVLLKASGGSVGPADLLYVGYQAVDAASWQAGWPVELLGNAEPRVSIVIADDGVPEPDETLHLTLTVLTGDAVVGAQSNAVLTIVNGYPRVLADSRPFAEEGTPVRCQLWRRGDTNFALSVQYATEDDTARAGVDYVAAAGSVIFAAGQLEAEIQVPTLDNGRVDGDRAFLLNFSTATSGVELRDTMAVAVIVDNEQPVVWDRTFDPLVGASWYRSIAVSADGKMIVDRDNTGEVVRWNADGSLDRGFARALLTFGDEKEGNAGAADSLVLDTEGRCLVVGYFDAVNRQRRSGLARLTSDGALDETFNPPSSLTNFRGSMGLALQPDGRMLIWGFDNLEGQRRLVRLDPDGSLDHTFQPAAMAAEVMRVWATANNQAIVEVPELTASTTSRPVARLASDGSLDRTFHRAEFTPLQGAWSSGIMDLAPQPDGKLLVAGWFRTVDGHPRPRLVRLNADGTVDAGFVPPADSWPDHIGAGGEGEITAIAPDPQGRVWVAGMFHRFDGEDAGVDYSEPWGRTKRFLLVRLKANGIPDDGFEPVDDSACREFLPPKLGLNQFYSGGRIHRLFPQPDGKLLVSGECGVRTGKWDITVRNFVARLFGEPPTNSIGFTSPQFLAEAGVSSATITVWRLGDTTGPATVAYATRDDSALAGRDYVAASGTLSFAPLEVTKSFSVPLLDPDRRRQDRELSVTLSDATGVAGISGPEARLVLMAPFGFRGIAGLPSAPRLTIFGSVGSTHLLESCTPQGHPSNPWLWSSAATAVTLTNEVQTIPDDPSWHEGWPDATAPARFYRLRHLAP